MVTEPQKNSAPIGAAVVIVLAGFALWLLAGHGFLKYRLEGQWRSSEPLPRMTLTLKKDGGYDWGTADPNKGTIRHGRWRIEADDKLEFVEPAGDMHLQFRLTMDRRMNSMLILDGRYYMPGDK
jgi:hypothetical protein